jgi:hypothetical protein
MRFIGKRHRASARLDHTSSACARFSALSIDVAPRYRIVCFTAIPCPASMRQAHSIREAAKGRSSRVELHHITGLRQCRHSPFSAAETDGFLRPHRPPWVSRRILRAITESCSGRLRRPPSTASVRPIVRHGLFIVRRLGSGEITEAARQSLIGGRSGRSGRKSTPLCGDVRTRERHAPLFSLNVQRGVNANTCRVGSPLSSPSTACRMAGVLSFVGVCSGMWLRQERLLLHVQPRRITSRHAHPLW